MMRLIIILLTIMLFSLAGQAQEKVNLDSLATVITQLSDDTVKLRQILELADEYNRENGEVSLKYYQYGKDLAQRLDDEKWLVQFYNRIGNNYANRQELDSALFYYNKMYPIYMATNDLQGISNSHNCFLYVYKRKGELDKAHYHATEFIKTAEQIGNPMLIAKAYGKLGSLFYYKEYYEDAKEATLKAYEVAVAANLPMRIGYASRLLGDIYAVQNEPEKALEYYQKTMDIYIQEDWKVGIALTNVSIGSLLVVLEQYAEGLAAFEAAENFYQEYYNQSILTDHQVYYSYAIAHLKMGAPDKALIYFKKALPFVEEQDKKNVKWKIYHNIADAYGQLTQFDSAFYYSSQFRYAFKDYFHAENNETMEELRVKFALSEKENTILKQEQQIAMERTRFWLALVGLALFAVVGVVFYRLSQQLKQRNQEKEFLIKEVHHRVKNNLQTLSSLLNMQSRYIEDDIALSAIQEGQHRVETMGLIHQKLYTGENLATVDMQEYLPELGENLLDSFGVVPGHIIIDFKVEDIRLDVDSAIPVSLIINELLTNALKYAFPASEPGRIEVSLWKDGDQHLNLKIADNGVGQREVSDSANSTKFGSRLIKILSKRLEGQFKKLDTTIGYTVQISFKNAKIV